MITPRSSPACLRLGQAIIAATADVDGTRIVDGTLIYSMIVEISLLCSAVRCHNERCLVKAKVTLLHDHVMRLWQCLV
jgi:hypothetical protein